MMKQARLDYIDIAKGLGMLTIIWGHIVTYGFTNSFVYAFHIPLFFFLSGCVFNRTKYASYKEFLIKKVKSLLIPYVIFSFLSWGIYVLYECIILNGSFKDCIQPLLQTFIAQGSGGYLTHNVPLWFISCLFIVENIYWFLSKYKVRIILTVIILCAIVGYFMNTQSYAINIIHGINLTELPWNIEVALSALIFYAIGSLLINKYSHERIIKTITDKRALWICLCIVLWLITAIGSQFNGHVSMGSNRLGNPFIFYPIAICGTAAMFILTILLSSSKYNTKPTLSFVKWFGRNSYYAMAIHNPIKGIVVIVVTALFTKLNILGSSNNNYAIALVSFMITMIIVVISIVVINWILKKCLRKPHFSQKNNE